MIKLILLLVALAVLFALVPLAVGRLARRCVDKLSGGKRQPQGP